MAKKAPRSPADFIVPLNINGLEGRMLRLSGPTRSQKEILFVYGHHSSIERWWGIIQVLSKYATVTVPDLPGFGGMDSFYKIGKKPTIDNLADYLAAFIKMRYKRKKIIIVGLSFGFVIVTRMLQRYPELSKKVVMLISIVGFAHKDDFTFSKTRYYSYLLVSQLLSKRLPAIFFRYIVLRPVFLRSIYGRTHNAKNKFIDTTKEEFNYLMDFEIGLWHLNDVRTHMFTSKQFLQFDNCQQTIDLPVWHVSAKADHFFDNFVVEQHMRIIFTDFHYTESRLKSHAPSVIADEKMAAPLIPASLRRAIRNI